METYPNSSSPRWVCFRSKCGDVSSLTSWHTTEAGTFLDPFLRELILEEMAEERGKQEQTGDWKRESLELGREGYLSHTSYICEGERRSESFAEGLGPFFPPDSHLDKSGSSILHITARRGCLLFEYWRGTQGIAMSGVA